jgi:hypothetical protein
VKRKFWRFFSSRVPQYNVFSGELQTGMSIEQRAESKTQSTKYKVQITVDVFNTKCKQLMTIDN